MRKPQLRAALALTLALAGCPDEASGPGDASGSDLRDGAETGDSEVTDTVEGDGSDAETSDAADTAETWTFDRSDYEPVHGWILLDADPEATAASIERAASYGVNHVQLSHGLIANIDDVLGDDASTLARIETLNMATELAHQHGMKAYVWAHELSEASADFCYEPGSPDFEAREDAYREGLARLPAVDGVVMMFGSAPLSPWFTFCSCAYCEETYEGGPLERPPNAEKLRLVVEELGGVITGELGRELFVRTFVHEPAEIEWHGDGLSAVRGVPFTGMHKGPVQDWQPYNPHHPNMGHVGPHPSVVELDVAGEYYGLSLLPFAAPGYYRYRMDHMWANRGIGAVIRVERGSRSALGTPNEINVLTVRRLIEDPATPPEAIWDEFLEERYGLAPDSPGHAALRVALGNTFPVRLESHYVLGIWALDKGSDLPESAAMGELFGRGRMPKWDPDWQAVWGKVNKPDLPTVRRIWQEGSEAVALAAESLAMVRALEGVLEPDDYADLSRRMAHQLAAARSWRAEKLHIWAGRARENEADDALLLGWMSWARAELAAIREEMNAAGLGDVQLASPGRIQTFLDATGTGELEATEPVEPETARFSPLRVLSTEPERAVLMFAATEPGDVAVEWGLELPDFGTTTPVGTVEAGAETTFSLDGLEPGRRYVARVRADAADGPILGGESWIFTPHPCACGAAEVCVEGRCLSGCTPDCLGLCAGAPDGCGGACAENDCRGGCEGTICLATEGAER